MRRDAAAASGHLQSRPLRSGRQALVTAAASPSADWPRPGAPGGFYSGGVFQTVRSHGDGRPQVPPRHVARHRRARAAGAVLAVVGGKAPAWLPQTEPISLSQSHLRQISVLLQFLPFKNGGAGGLPWFGLK